MREVKVYFQAVRHGENIVLGLEEGYVVVDEQVAKNIVRYSRDGNFWPYKIEERLPTLDQPGRVALRVKLIPSLRPSRP
jgi:hypothetical protein